MQRTKHAILTYNHLVTIEHGQVMREDCTPSSLTHLCNLATHDRLTHLWVLPETGLDPTREFATYDESAWSLLINWKHDRVISLTGWKLPGGGQHQFTIVFTQHTSWANGKPGEPGWIIQATPEQILDTIAHLEKAFDVSMGGSPSTMGWKFLEKIHPEWITDRPLTDLKSCHFGAESGHDLVWQRPLTEGESKQKYLHKFDKNSAYLDAASSEFYGTGTPIHMFHGHDALQKPQAVGVWYCSLEKRDADPAIPPPYWFWKSKSEGWLAGPHIRLLLSQGYEVKITEGYVFPGRHQVLAQWSKKVWDIRQSFERGTFEQIATKHIAVSTIGLTAYRKFAEDESTDKKRPDIRMQTVARTAEKMYFNILKVRSNEGVTPLMVYTDALYYMSDSPHGETDFPTLMERQGKLGGYKYEGHIELTDEIRAIQVREDRPPIVESTRSVLQSKGDILAFLNKIGWRVN